MANPLVELGQFGQSPWLDNISRGLITSGQLKALIDEDGLKGVTSNPAIFEKSITGSTDYDAAIAQLASQNKTAMAIYEALAIDDIQQAADVLRSVYEKTNGRDGFISLEVSPYLANDTAGTIEEARRLWQAVDRNNVMIKVPATEAGIPAFRQLICDGLNVNVTLMFSFSVYEAVAAAYISGLEDRAAQGGDVSGINSVTSFFISRIDSLVDDLLEHRAQEAISALEQEKTRSLIGKVAIANGTVTYQRYRELFTSTRWQKLADQGAKTQRVLWASTSTKNPDYRDVLYVEELIGKDTINTLPDATLAAFRDHGRLSPTLENGLADARAVMHTVAEVGISMDEVADQLVKEGVKKFVDPFEDLINAIEQKRLQPVV
jgi:transaldolase/glucose-6-phosphate isomerase